MATTTWQPGGNLQSLLQILGNPLADVSIAGDELTIEGASQAELDAAAATYAADPDEYILQPQRRNQKQHLLNLAYAFTLGRYSQSRQALFHALLTETIIDELPNRGDYIRELLDWLKLVTGALMGAEAAVDLATTAETIKAVQINFDTLGAADPGITIKAALTISD